MILEPLNDRSCLDQLTAHVRANLSVPELLFLAQQFPRTAAAAAYLRGRPQRDDLGDPADGPRVTCDVTQRVRFPEVNDPNCVERALTYLGIAELLEPQATRQLATIDTPRGRQTLPIEDGAPVVLDPRQTRNACQAGLWHVRRSGAPAPTFAPGHEWWLVRWLAEIAEEPALALDGPRGIARVERGREVLECLLSGRLASRLREEPPPRRQSLLGAVVFLLAMAERVAPLWGIEGIANVRAVRTALARLGLLPRDRRRRDVDLGDVQNLFAHGAGKTVLQAFGLGGVADLVGSLGEKPADKDGRDQKTAAAKDGAKDDKDAKPSGAGGAANSCTCTCVDRKAGDPPPPRVAPAPLSSPIPGGWGPIA